MVMHTTTGSINHAMRRANIPRRTASSTNHLRFLKSPKSFSQKANLTDSEKQLKVAGLMLYWAEGAKRNSKCVDFANSDPDMIKLFIHFLRKIYSVDETKFRIYLYTFPNLPMETTMQFWSNLTKVAISQFSKPYIRIATNQVHDKMPHGLVHIRYSDIRLLRDIMLDIEQIKC